MIVVFGFMFLIYHNDHHIYNNVPEMVDLLVLFGVMFLIYHNDNHIII